LYLRCAVVISLALIVACAYRLKGLMKPSFENIREQYSQPLLDLLYKAHGIHRANHDVNQMQKCSLLSIKTGGCPENCSYCPQSAHYQTGLDKEGLMDLGQVEQAIGKAKSEGAQRFCMGAAWREVRSGKAFDQVLQMVKMVKSEGMEACVTLGMLNKEQAEQLKEAGLDAYNHNLDSSREFYDKIITTREYDDRLKTLNIVAETGISVCSGGILGMGESDEDRCSLIAELAALDPQPESVPINLLIPVKGTPLEDQKPVDPLELVRMIATTRIFLPKSRVRLSAGRVNLNRETQTLAFFAGANSIFSGDVLLTRENPRVEEDAQLMNDLGMSYEMPL